jgi:hypothetical protein
MDIGSPASVSPSKEIASSRSSTATVATTPSPVM